MPTFETSMSDSQRSVLLVEDDFFDTMTVQKSFEKFNVPHQLHTAFNGLEALDLLLGHNGAAAIDPLPEVILLDLNMPKMNGHELLAELQQHAHLRDIPVFVTTSSEMDIDRLQAEELNVRGYIIKPLDFENTRDMVDSMSLLETLLK